MKTANQNIAKGKTAEPALAPLTIIRTETVLSRLPIHNLAKKGRVNISISKKNAEGKTKLFWEVSYNEKYGQARQLAYKLDTVVVNRRLDEQKKPLPKMIYIGSLHEIAQELGLKRDTNSVKKAALQNAFTAITAKLTYKGVDGSEHSLEAGFTRYSVVFTGERLPDGRRADGVYLILNEPYWEVLNNAPVRPLDYDYLKLLPPAAQRFYEIMSFRIFGAINSHRANATMTYSEYCTYSAQQRYFDFNRVKKQMYKIHRPHMTSQYIAGVKYTSMTDENGAPDWMMRYVPGEKAHAEYQSFTRKKLQKTSATKQVEENTAHTNAVALVGYFYQRFHQQEVTAPNSKEITQAAEMIATHGVERARFIVDHSFQEAQDTNYSPKFFGGILQYVPRAIARFDQRENVRRDEESRKQNERLEEAYERYRQDEIKWMRSSLSPDEFAAMEASIRAELKAEGTLPAMIGVGVIIRLDAQFEERAGILPYDVWKNQQQPNSSQGRTA